MDQTTRTGHSLGLVAFHRTIVTAFHKCSLRLAAFRDEALDTSHFLVPTAIVQQDTSANRAVSIPRILRLRWDGISKSSCPACPRHEAYLCAITAGSNVAVDNLDRLWLARRSVGVNSLVHAMARIQPCPSRRYASSPGICAQHLAPRISWGNTTRFSNVRARRLVTDLCVRPYNSFD